MVVIEYICMFILLAVIVFGSAPEKFYEWMNVKFFSGKKQEPTNQVDDDSDKQTLGK